MADTTTELEVLDEIIVNLGGEAGHHETVVPALEDIRDLLSGGGSDGSGYNPSLSVGRADALTGADSTAQWATRESTGSGAATVRSVQGAAVVFRQRYNYEKRPSTVISGVDVVNNNDGSITLSGTATAEVILRWNYNDNYTLLTGHKYLEKFCPPNGSSNTYYAWDSWNGRFNYDTGAGSIFTANADTYLQPALKIVNGATINGTVYPQFFDLTTMFGAGNEPTTVAEFERMFPEAYYPYSAATLKPVQIDGISSTYPNGNALDSAEWSTQTLRAAGSVCDELTAGELVTRVGVRAYQSGDESDATVRTDGTTTYYPLATPTTTPISPALPMTYRVEQGGTESIVVPDGEISAAPLLTIAEGESAADVVMDALACIATPDGPTATANHAINTYLTMGGKLYKVTSAIAVGETITPNTNVTETTVMAELLALTA